METDAAGITATVQRAMDELSEPERFQVALALAKIHKIIETGGRPAQLAAIKAGCEVLTRWMQDAPAPTRQLASRERV